MHGRAPGKLKEGARALYTPAPTEEELAGTGFTVADYADDDFELWPENMPAIHLFSSLSTQWRHGMNGPTGLDYNVLFSRMDRMKLSERDYDWLFDDVQVIEREALSAINSKK